MSELIVNVLDASRRPMSVYAVVRAVRDAIADRGIQHVYNEYGSFDDCIEALLITGDVAKVGDDKYIAATESGDRQVAGVVRLGHSR